jgi:hypothetical protein
VEVGPYCRVSPIRDKAKLRESRRERRLHGVSATWDGITSPKCYSGAMTVPKRDQSCSRCGIRPKRPGRTRLCEECSGNCRKCGRKVRLRPSDVAPRAICDDCKILKATCFRCGAPRDGSHVSYCNACYKAYEGKWRRDNPEKARLKERRRTLRRFHGMTLKDYDDMLDRQGGGCAICGVPPEEAQGRITGRGVPRYSLHVDHCHAQGHVRGLLCHHCNIALGEAKDNPVTLRRMADYLEQAPLSVPPAPAAAPSKP